MPDLADLDYQRRLTRVIDHVHRHLSEPLTLNELAQVACFSPHHFHRVFRALTGETPHGFVRRVRLERANYLRAHHPGRTLTDIALDCGFSSSSDFSRTFRKVYGVAPRDFDLDAHRRARRSDLPMRAPAEAAHNPDGFEVVLRELPARHVACLAIAEPFDGGVPEGAARLMAWADARGLGQGAWLGYMWEEPEISAMAHCRYVVAVVVPADTPTDGEVGLVRLPPMRVAEVSIDGDLHLETRAFDWLYGCWLPSSGYVPDHHPAFEAWVGRPYAHGEERFTLAVQLPVVSPSSGTES